MDNYRKELFFHLSKFAFSSIILILSITLLIPQIRVNKIFKPILCVVINKQVVTNTRLKNFSYKPEFLVMYQVDKKIYKVWTYDIYNTVITNTAIQSQVMNEFQIGVVYTCWYDPHNASNIVIKRSWDQIYVLFCCMALIVSLVTGISLLKLILQNRKNAINL